MNHIEPTARRIEVLRRALDLVGDQIVSLPGFTCGIGLASGVLDRVGLSPETVLPADLVITISFSQPELLEGARAEINQLLPNMPLELVVAGPFQTM